MEVERWQMLHDVRSAAPWIGIFILLLLVAVGATRTARHCLLGHEFSIKVGVIHRVAAPFWGVYCERADTISLRRTVF